MKTLTKLLLVLTTGQALATTGPKISIIQQDDGLLLSVDGRLQQLDLPSDLKGLPHYTVRMPVREAFPDKLKQKSTPAAPLEDLATLLVRAKGLLGEKNYAGAMEVLARAEKLDGTNTTIKNMRGSIFYLLGMPTMAKEAWEHSLALNPNQPKVAAYIAKVGQ